jgi:hypothetical protein
MGQQQAWVAALAASTIRGKHRLGYEKWSRRFAGDGRKALHLHLKQ